MKRIVFTIGGITLIHVIAFISCTSNKVEPEPGRETTKEISLNIHVPKADAVTTYAVEDGSIAENRIDTIYIDLKQAGVSIYSGKFFGNDLKIEPGSKDSIVHMEFEVDNITMGALTIEAHANRNYIQPIMTEIPLPDTSDPKTLFMMSGSAGLSYTGTAYQGTVHLIRNVSKLRTRITKHPVCLPSDLIIDYDNIKVQLLKVANQTTLFGPGEATGQPEFGYIDYPERTGTQLRKASHFSSVDGGQIDSLYLNENYLTNEGNYNQSNTTKVKITIPTKSPTEGEKTDSYEYEIFTNNSFRILRNFIYTLDIQVRGQGLAPVITIGILPWNDAEIEGSILGTYLTTGTSVIEFDDKGSSIVYFCTDAQALYIDWSEVKEHINRSLIPEGIEILSDEKGQILLDKQHCGHFSFRLEPTTEEAGQISGTICMTAGNITKCLPIISGRTYDAHYIVGDSLMGSRDTYIAATVENGGTWLQLSKNKPYKQTEMLSAYTEGTAVPLFLHLDENLTGAARTGTVSMTRSDGTTQKLKITQLPALYVGQFGTTSIEQFNITYEMGLYTEQIPEEKGLQYKISNDNSTFNSSFYSGLQIIPATLNTSGYMDNYQNVPYPAINYCAYKNRDKNGNGTLEVNEIEWYLPAQAQLMGMWTSFHGYWEEPTSGFPLNIYWSTSNNQAYLNEAQYVNFSYGNVGHYLRTQKYSARCVRNYGAADNTMIAIEGVSPDEYPVIDFSKGMPPGSYSSEDKEFVQGHENSNISKTVYTKLRIAKNDLTDESGNAIKDTWEIMRDICHSYIEEETAGWRLPTQREMQAVWIFQEELKAKHNAFEYLADDYYWTRTVSALYLDNAWTLYGSRSTQGGGNTPHQLKTELLRVRCVKQLQ